MILTSLKYSSSGEEIMHLNNKNDMKERYDKKFLSLIMH